MSSSSLANEPTSAPLVSSKVAAFSASPSSLQPSSTSNSICDFFLVPFLEITRLLLSYLPSFRTSSAWFSSGLFHSNVGVDDDHDGHGPDRDQNRAEHVERPANAAQVGAAPLAAGAEDVRHGGRDDDQGDGSYDDAVENTLLVVLEGLVAPVEQEGFLWKKEEKKGEKREEGCELVLGERRMVLPVAFSAMGTSLSVKVRKMLSKVTRYLTRGEASSRLKGMPCALSASHLRP